MELLVQWEIWPCLTEFSLDFVDFVDFVKSKAFFALVCPKRKVSRNELRRPLEGLEDRTDALGSEGGPMQTLWDKRSQQWRGGKHQATGALENDNDLSTSNI